MMENTHHDDRNSRPLPRLGSCRQPVWMTQAGVGDVVIMGERGREIIIIIMYIYHALINALSAHMIHVSL